MIIKGPNHGASSWVLGLLVAASSSMAWAEPARCDALSQKQAQIKREVFASLHPYDGCDETFLRCLAKNAPHNGVLRMADDICRQISAGKSKQEIERAIAKRAQTMLPATKLASFALDDSTLAGDPSAPVTVVVYACARCPFCKVLVAGLYKEVTSGVLLGKARLYFRPFPIKSHPGSTEGGLAIVSAARLGRFWPFVIKMYERYDQFSPDLLSTWAAEEGMDKEAFEKDLADPKNREALVASKQEGIRNKVEATPTLFVEGRRYVYELQQDAVVDVLLEAYESTRESRRKP